MHESERGWIAMDRSRLYHYISLCFSPVVLPGSTLPTDVIVVVLHVVHARARINKMSLHLNPNKRNGNRECKSNVHVLAKDLTV